MQFPNPIVAELHLIGTNTRVDIDGLGGNQPTIWFSNPDRSVSSFINAPSAGNPITFMGLAMDSSTWVSSNLPGNPTLRSRVYLSLGTIDIGNNDATTQGAIGGRFQAYDNGVAIYFTPGPNSAAFTSRVLCLDGQVLVTDNAGNGFGLDTTDDELKALTANVVNNWTALTLQNGWSAAAGYYAPAYRFTPTGQLELRGVMSGGTNADNTVICLMPVVPAKLGLHQPVLETGGTVNARLFYNTDGKLYCYGCAGAGKIGLDGARFSYK